MFSNRLADTLNDLFSVIMIFQTIMPVLTIAFVLYKLSGEVVNLIEFTILIIYLFAIICEMFFYCWFASLLSVKVSSWSVQTQIENK